MAKEQKTADELIAAFQESLNDPSTTITVMADEQSGWVWDTYIRNDEPNATRSRIDAIGEKLRQRYDLKST